MMNRLFALLTSIIVWLLVIVAALIFYILDRNIENLTKLLVSFIPSLLFITVGLLIFSRDRERVKYTKEKNERRLKLDASWGDALKHDLITYFIPVIILGLPFIFKKLPSIVDLWQAIIAFITYSYLKYLYWREL